MLNPSQKALFNYIAHSEVQFGKNKGLIEYYNHPFWKDLIGVPITKGDYVYRSKQYLILLYYIETGKI